MLYLVEYVREYRRICTVVTAENLNHIIDSLRCVDWKHHCDDKFHTLIIHTIKKEDS